MLRLVHANDDAKTLAAPKVKVFDGENASIRIQKTVRYKYADPNSAADEPVEKVGEVKIGTIFEALPKLQADGERIDLTFEFEHRNLIGFTNGLPNTEIVRVKSRLVVPDGGTLLLGGMKINAEQEDGQRMLNNIFLLIKLKKLDPGDDSTEPAPSGGRI